MKTFINFADAENQIIPCVRIGLVAESQEDRESMERLKEFIRSEPSIIRHLIFSSEKYVDFMIEHPRSVHQIR